MTKSLTKISDLSVETVNEILSLAFDYKKKHDLGVRHEEVLSGKAVAMVFEKPSLRTKVAFEIAAEYLGGKAIFLSAPQILASGSQVVGRESIPDIARNLERFVDLILARVYSHQTIRVINQNCRVPVINALCDEHHPTQALADLMAIRWHASNDECTVSYVGDGNNVATSLMQICALMGLKFQYSCPSGYEIPDGAVSAANEMAKKQDHKPRKFDTPQEAVANADFIYTDTFVSMGQEEDTVRRMEDFQGFQVTKNLINSAGSNAKFMHCLPAHRGEEVTDEVMDSKNSIIFDQAECRMHIAKALIHYFLA